MKAKIIGYSLLFVVFVVYSYFTLWVYVKPFLTKDNYLDKFFLDKYWAIALPIYVAALIYTLLFIFLSIVFMFSYKQIYHKGDLPIEKDIQNGKIVINKQKIE